MVAAVYDTLTVPNTKGVATPYLAKSVEPNADFTVWTIGLRDGVKFHDGTPVDAAAVKLNLDSIRGAPGAPNVGSLLPIIFGPIISDVVATDASTVSFISVPSGADIQVDGQFLGSAPAELPLTLGQRTIKISKKGFKPYERTIQVLSSGSQRITAELEPD